MYELHVDNGLIEDLCADVSRERADPLVIGAAMLRAVQKEKLHLLEKSVIVDGSWQSSASWVCAMPDLAPWARSVMERCIMGAIDPTRAQKSASASRCMEDVFSLSNRCRAHAQHRRDQVLVRSLPMEALHERSDHEHVITILAGTPVTQADRDRNDIWHNVLPATRERSALKERAISLSSLYARHVTNKAIAEEADGIRQLLSRVRSALSNAAISEICFYVQETDSAEVNEHAHRRARTLSRCISTLYNFASFDEGEADLMTVAAFRKAATA